MRVFYIFLVVSFILHFIFVSTIARYGFKGAIAYLQEPITFYFPKSPASDKQEKKITFTTQKFNQKNPSNSKYLAEFDNSTEKETRTKNSFIRQMNRDKFAKPQAEKHALSKDYENSALLTNREENKEKQLPTLEEYLEDFGEKNQMPEGEYVSINTTSFKFISYFGRLKQKIEFVLNLPEEAQRNGITGSGVVGFIIGEDGELLNCEILKTAGYRVLDDEIMRAIRTAAPYEPLPKSMGQDKLMIKSYFSFMGGSY